MAVISGLRIGKINVWPGDVLDSYDRIGGMSNQQVTEALQTVSVTSDNSTEPMRLVNFFFHAVLIHNVNNICCCLQKIKIDNNMCINDTTDL